MVPTHAGDDSGGEIIEFMDQGDAAPNARFAWRFRPTTAAAESQ